MKKYNWIRQRLQNFNSKMLWSRIVKIFLQWKNKSIVQCTMLVQKCIKLLIDWPDSPWWWTCVYPLNPCAGCVCLHPMTQHHKCPSLCCPRPCVFPRPHRSAAAPPLPVSGSRCPHCCLHGWRKARGISHDEDVICEGAEENNDHMVLGLIDALIENMKKSLTVVLNYFEGPVLWKTGCFLKNSSDHCLLSNNDLHNT